MIRSIWVLLNLFFATVIIAGAVVIAAFLRIVHPWVYDMAPRTWSRWVLWASAVRVRREGMQNLHLEEPQVFASNHQSWYDVFALAVTIPKRYRFIAKKELAKIPIFGRAWQAAGHISVDRGDRTSAIRSLDQAGELIRRDNSSVVIFPEGTRSRTGRLQPFKKGAFMLALRTGVEIVPVACIGTRDVQRKGSWRVRPGTVIVRFGEAIDTSRYSEATRDELIAEVYDRIEALLTRPAPAERQS